MKATWFVSNFPHHANEQAGIFYKILADALVQQGCELTVVAPTPSTGFVLPMLSSKWKQYAQAPEEEIFDSLRIFRPRYFTLPGETDSRFAHKRIVSVCQKLKLPSADIVHAFGSYPVNFAALQLAQMWDKPFVQTFIGSDVNDYPHRGDHQMKMFTELVQQSQRVLAVSDDLNQKIEKITGIRPEKVAMPVSRAPHISKPKEEIRKHYHIDESKFIVLFAGSLIKEKGINELLAAMGDDRLKQCKLILAGPDPDDISIPDPVQKMGSLPHEELLTLMSVCDVLVLPSYSEGIPGVVKEAGQMQLPVIATRVGGIPEIVDETCGYLIQAHDAKAIVQAILEVRNNPDESQRRAGKLHTRVTAEFEGASIAQKLMDIYADTLNRYRS